MGDVEEYGGEEMYIEFGGERVEVVDEMRGERKKGEVFVGMVGLRDYR